MKRMNIISQPTSTDALADYDFDNIANSGQLRAERIEAKRRRQFKHQYI